MTLHFAKLYQDLSIFLGTFFIVETAARSDYAFIYKILIMWCKIYDNICFHIICIHCFVCRVKIKICYLFLATQFLGNSCMH